MIKSLIKPVILAVLILWGTYVAFKWTVMRVYVPPGKGLKVTHKFGKPLPPELIAIPAGWSGHKGVHEELLGPGRYFLNPVSNDWELVDLVTIPAGEPAKWEWDPYGRIKDPETAPKIGLVSSRQGKTAP